MRARRQMARAAGSTYAPEFLGMMKLELINKWSSQQIPFGHRALNLGAMQRSLAWPPAQG